MSAMTFGYRIDRSAEPPHGAFPYRWEVEVGYGEGELITEFGWADSFRTGARHVRRRMRRIAGFWTYHLKIRRYLP